MDPELFSAFLLGHTNDYLQEAGRRRKRLDRNAIKAPPADMGVPPDLTSNPPATGDAGAQGAAAGATNPISTTPATGVDTTGPDGLEAPTGGEDPSNMGGADISNEDPNATGEDDMISADPEQAEQQVDDPTMDDGTGGDPTADPTADPSQPPAVPSLDTAETEYFSFLKPEQFTLKKENLKLQYKKFNALINDTIDKMSQTVRDSDDKHVMEFITEKLMQLNDISRDALIKVFDTRTYIENQVELQRLLLAYNTIIRLLQEIRDNRISKQDKQSKKFIDTNKEPKRINSSLRTLKPFGNRSTIRTKKEVGED